MVLSFEKCPVKGNHHVVAIVDLRDAFLASEGKRVDVRYYFINFFQWNQCISVVGFKRCSFGLIQNGNNLVEFLQLVRRKVGSRFGIHTPEDV